MEFENSFAPTPEKQNFLFGTIGARWGLGWGAPLIGGDWN